MTHQKWQSLEQPTDPSAIRETVAYTRGYILALEDVLGDLNQMTEEAPKVPYDTHTLMFAKARVHRDLDSAHRTLASLEEKLNDPNDQDGPGDTPDHARGQDPSSLPQ